MIAIILQILNNFLGKGLTNPKAAPITSIPLEEQNLPVTPDSSKPKESNMGIDWSNPKAKISKYFTVHEACFLPSWGVLHIPTEEEKANILKTAQKMDLVREFLGESITVSVWLRPKSCNCNNPKFNGQDYNTWLYNNVVWKNLTPEAKALKKVPNSPHRTGDAVDWILTGKNTNEACDIVRSKLLPKLEEFGVRMEDVSHFSKRNWVHIDTRQVVNKRYFKP
jgi:hypothetical protein